MQAKVVAQLALPRKLFPDQLTNQANVMMAISNHQQCMTVNELDPPSFHGKREVQVPITAMATIVARHLSHRSQSVQRACRPRTHNDKQERKVLHDTLHKLRHATDAGSIQSIVLLNQPTNQPTTMRI